MVSKLSATVEKQQQARPVEQQGEQQVFHTGGIEQPEAITARHQCHCPHQAIALTTQGKLEQEQADQQIGHQYHGGGDEQQVGIPLAEQPHQQQAALHRQAGEPQRRYGGAVAILASEDGWEGTVAGSAVGHLGREQGPAHVRSEYRDDEADTDQHLAPGACHLGHQPRHGGIGQGSELGATQYPQRQYRDEHIKQQRQHYPEHCGRAHVPLVPRTGRQDGCPFDAGKDPEGDQHGVAHLLGDRHSKRAAPP